MKQGLKNGYVVKTDKGKIGMIVWRRDNDNIGINFGHYHIFVNVHKKEGQDLIDSVRMMGAEDVFCKHQIVEIISTNQEPK
jgi:hypothetical protein